MRRFATAAASVLLALTALTMPATANADSPVVVLPRPAQPYSPTPPAPPKGTWTFTANYLSLQTCQGDGQQYVKLVPQDKLARCEASTTLPGIYDLWLLYVLPHTGQ